MSVYFDDKKNIFALNTRNTTYMIGLIDGMYPGHIYYGRHINKADGEWLMRNTEGARTPSVNNREKACFFYEAMLEYPAAGKGDFRECCIKIRTREGYCVCEPVFDSFRIYEGKPALKGLPSSFAQSSECDTLEIVLKDTLVGVKIILVYSVFNDLDVITRSVRVINESSLEIYLERVLSACLDMDNEDFDMVTLNGAWGRERNIVRRAVVPGKQSVSSVQGKTSAQDHPFVMLLDKGADQDKGNVYGMHFVYSGNFLISVEESQFKSLRCVMGINPENFCWKLEAGDEFTAPEAVLVYSSDGIGNMSRTYHDFYRKHLIRSRYLGKDRPILVNNWEATYFDFNTEKLLQIAAEAKKYGIEMLVMDDGWFGKRSNDASSLGDWFVNEQKLPGGIKYLSEQVNALGMKFGLWFEPEMVSPDSELYRSHPDWAIQVPGREIAQQRQQYMLDITRKEVSDYVYESVAGILRNANVAYVKWDMNRSLTDIGSAILPADRQQEFSHRYVLAVYALQERLITEFPELLLENCSAGGARFDPGMLYYSPQIWCSDDMDVAERLIIQEGTALCYPLSTMGAHVGASPNHTTGRRSPFTTRGYAALMGTFGYELDVTKLSMEEKELIPEQCADYHKYHHLVENGDYYRLESYAQNHEFDCTEIVSKDKAEALIIWIQVQNRPNYHGRKVHLKGLDLQASYICEETGRIYPADILMYGGIIINRPFGDLLGGLIHLKKVKD